MTKAEIQLVRALADKRGRAEHGLFIAEGEKLIGELRASHLRVRRIFALEGLFEGPETETVSPRDMERISQLKTPSNSLALVEIPRHRLDAEHLGNRLTLALDEVQNPGNLGTIIRLADWFGIGDIVCSEGSADCFNPKVVQATMGAILRVRIHYAPLTPLLAAARRSRRTGRGRLRYVPRRRRHLLGRPHAGRDRRDGERGTRRDRRGRPDGHPKALHSPVSGRKGGLRIAQCRHGDGHRLLGVPPASAQLTARRTGHATRTSECGGAGRPASPHFFRAIRRANCLHILNILYFCRLKHTRLCRNTDSR